MTYGIFQHGFSKQIPTRYKRVGARVFNAVPGMVGQKFVYSRVDREIKSRDLKEAMELLETAGVVTRLRQVNRVDLPLAASVNETYFKVIFLDVGLFHAISGIYAETAI